MEIAPNQVYNILNVTEKYYYHFNEVLVMSSLYHHVLFGLLVVPAPQHDTVPRPKLCCPPCPGRTATGAIKQDRYRYWPLVA
jgi:hypothetical protein